MGPAVRIRSHRVRAGKSPGEVARQLGLNEAWYQDLEHDDDALASTLTLFQAMELATALGVRLHDLVPSDSVPARSIPLVDLPALIDAHVARNGLSVEQFEEAVGWKLREFLRSPLTVAAEAPLVFLQTLTEHLGIDWLAVVPDEHEG